MHSCFLRHHFFRDHVYGHCIESGTLKVKRSIIARFYSNFFEAQLGVPGICVNCLRIRFPFMAIFFEDVSNFNNGALSFSDSNGEH